MLNWKNFNNFTMKNLLKRDAKDALEAQVDELITKSDDQSNRASGLERIKKNLEAEVDSLSTRLEAESKKRVNLEKTKKKLEGDLNDLKVKFDIRTSGTFKRRNKPQKTLTTIN